MLVIAAAYSEAGSMSRRSVGPAHFSLRLVERSAIGWARNTVRWTTARCRRCRFPGQAGLFHWEPCGAPCLKTTHNVSRVGKAQLLQCRRREAGLITLIAEQDDLIVELWRTGMAEVTRWIQPPFQNVSGDYERFRDDAIAGGLRIGANVDHGCPAVHCLQRLSRIEPGQAAPYICQQLIDRGTRHGAHSR